MYYVTEYDYRNMNVTETPCSTMDAALALAGKSQADCVEVKDQYGRNLIELDYTQEVE